MAMNVENEAMSLMDTAMEENREHGEKSIAKPNVSCHYSFIKRGFDFICSFLALVILFIPLAIVALCIYIDNPGPVLFSQERIGFKGKPFKMLKLRSMVVNAGDQLGDMTEAQREEFMREFKLKNDSRITRVGKFIRKTSIDELPQLINILIGDMSFVGPRPPLLVEREAYGEHLAKVMSVRPGLTGYWQVHGRSDTEFSERIEMNEYYIDHRSIGLDLKILAKTVGVVLDSGGHINKNIFYGTFRGDRRLGVGQKKTCLFSCKTRI